MPLRSKKSISRFFRYIYLKLFRINDSPQRISLGFGLGVFLGVLPGVGPVAAFAFAFLFRVNRAAAVLGSLLTNTWVGVVTFVLAVKAGSAIFGMDWHVVQSEWKALFKEFSFKNLMEFRDEAAAVMLGYGLISLVIGAAAYLVILFCITVFRKRLKGNKEEVRT